MALELKLGKGSPGKMNPWEFNFGHFEHILRSVHTPTLEATLFKGRGAVPCSTGQIQHILGMKVFLFQKLEQKFGPLSVFNVAHDGVVNAG